MPTVALRLPDETIVEIDGLVSAGSFATRTDVIKQALDRLFADLERERVDRAIIEGYRRIPETDEEMAQAHRNAKEMVDEEPW
jgi:Arc/MetJ-type ribon-helix-helix transcriptional regulator